MHMHTRDDPAIIFILKHLSGLPGDPVVENLSSNARHTGSVPGWGTKISHAAGQLSLLAANREAPRVPQQTPSAAKKERKGISV